MKIKVYTTTDESYSHGDLNNSNKMYFISKELRDEYFDFLRKYYLENLDMFELDEINSFTPKSGSGRWSYHIEKGEEDLEIIEEKNW